MAPAKSTKVRAAKRMGRSRSPSIYVSKEDRDRIESPDDGSETGSGDSAQHSEAASPSQEGKSVEPKQDDRSGGSHQVSTAVNPEDFEAEPWDLDCNLLSPPTPEPQDLVEGSACTEPPQTPPPSRKSALFSHFGELWSLEGGRIIPCTPDAPAVYERADGSLARSPIKYASAPEVSPQLLVELSKGDGVSTEMHIIGGRRTRSATPECVAYLKATQPALVASLATIKQEPQEEHTYLPAHSSSHYISRPEKPVFCPMSGCHTTFSAQELNEVYIVQHFLEVHKVQYHPAPKPRVTGRVVCPVPGADSCLQQHKVIRTKKDLHTFARHVLNVHIGIWGCECGATYSAASSLRKHQKDKHSD